MPKFFVIIICFFITGILGIFVVLPEYKDFKSLQFNIEQKEKELRYKEEYFSNLKDLDKQLETYKEERSKIDSALPNEPSLPGLFSFLQKTASENGLIVKNIGYNISSASSEKGPSEIREIRFSLALSGSYSAFKNFLFSLEKSARLWEIETFSLSSGKEGEKGEKEEFPSFSFDLQIRTHSY